ncbi:MAG: PTS glucose transporter subunit IIA [Selenomonadaceae bacterium]|nr:PTS glucose transporter subunit IIA [Selenomonadaceae bacterium]
MVQAFVNPGYDFFFRPSYILHNMAEGGACIGVGLRAKNKTLKGECFSLEFGCIVAGVTEPAIYGVNFRLKKPMIGVMAGAAVGGIVAGILGATAYVYGYSTILALPIFQETILSMAAAVIVAIIVSAIVTFVLGFDESLIVEPEEEPAKVVPTKSADVSSSAPVTELKAHATGESIQLADVNDGVFSAKMLGDGLTVQPGQSEVVAPADSTVCSIADSKHAIGLQLNNGVQILIHIGIDTVAMNGKGFTVHVKEGQQVNAGDKLVTFDRDEIKKAGYRDVIMMIVVENAKELPLNFQTYGNVTAGADTVVKFQ